MERKPHIDWDLIQPLVADLPMDREEVEGSLEALFYAWNELYCTPVYTTRGLLEVIGENLVREILQLLCVCRLPQVA